MRTIRTHNAYHLGDNLVHLNFLRRGAMELPGAQFIHAARWNHVPQMRDVVSDLKNVKLVALEEDKYYAYGDYTAPMIKDSVNAWRGAGGDWYNHPDRDDFVKYHVQHWFPRISGMLGIDNPIKISSDMLFDYPQICAAVDPWFKSQILVINSAPKSGQFIAYDDYALCNLAVNLWTKNESLIMTSPIPKELIPKGVIKCTEDYGLSVSQIGNLSLFARCIVMVSTGPSWPTFNVWNTITVQHRIILIDNEVINLAPNTVHCRTVREAAEKLIEYGYL
jgi:hypothetical protein